MNAVGLVDDVMTLLHEAGHAFHAFAAHEQPLIWQRHPGSEAAELASMSMELLAGPHLAQPDVGYFTPEDHRGAWLEHLEDVLLSLAHIASVDAFQSWIYTSGEGGDAAARDAAWLRIRARFERGVNWSGLEQERVARWYRQLHIFQYPFYYIEYGIAQIGRAPGLAQQPARPRPARWPGTAEPWRSAPCGAFRTSTARPARSSRSTPKPIGELVQLVEAEIERSGRSCLRRRLGLGVRGRQAPRRDRCRRSA